MANAFEVLYNKDLFFHIQDFVCGYEGLIQDFIVKYKYNKLPKGELIEEALAKENWRVVDKIYTNNYIHFNISNLSIWKIITSGYPHPAYAHLSTCKWLHEKMGDKFIYWRKYMTTAASVGDLDLVKYMHEWREEGCTTDAMDLAAANGHLKVLEFLHIERNEGCTKRAMDFASFYGHLEIVKFLHDNRNEGCSSDAMDLAAIYGNLDIIIFLHQHRHELYAKYAMNEAASKGYLRIVKFLYQNRKDVCILSALKCASASGKRYVVKYLQQEIKKIMHG